MVSATQTTPPPPTTTTTTTTTTSLSPQPSGPSSLFRLEDDDDDDDLQIALISCPSSSVGRVIGRNGNTIKALQRYTGARIRIDQTTEPACINVSGETRATSLAAAMVNDILNKNFKGFFLLREGHFNDPQLRPVYIPGFGLRPPEQLDTANIRDQAASTLAPAPPGALPSGSDVAAAAQSHVMRPSGPAPQVVTGSAGSAAAVLVTAASNSAPHLPAVQPSELHAQQRLVQQHLSAIVAAMQHQHQQQLLQLTAMLVSMQQTQQHLRLAAAMAAMQQQQQHHVRLQPPPPSPPFGFAALSQSTPPTSTDANTRPTPRRSS